MTPRWRITLGFQVAAAALIVVALCLVKPLPKEPVYQGKDLTEWLQQYAINHLSGRNPDLERQARAALGHLGTNSIPILLRMMATTCPPRVTRESLVERTWELLKARLLAWFGPPWLYGVSRPGRTTAEEEADDRRLLGAYGVIALGPAAKPAVPALVDLFQDKDPGVRDTAAFALRALGPLARDAVPALMNCLRDPGVKVRADAILMLGAIHQEPERVVPALIACLDRFRTNAILCSDGVWALRQFGGQASPAVPHLRALLNDSDPGLRSQATNALKVIDAEIAAAEAGVK